MKYRKSLYALVVLLLSAMTVMAGAKEGPETNDGVHKGSIFVNSGQHLDGSVFKDFTHFEGTPSSQAERDGWDFGGRAGYSCAYIEHFTDGVQDFSVHYELVTPYDNGNPDAQPLINSGSWNAEDKESEARANCGLVEYEGDGGTTGGGDPRRSSKALFDGTDHFPHSVSLVFYKDLNGDGLVTQSAEDELDRIDYPATCGTSYWTDGDEPGEAWLWFDEDGAADALHHGSGGCNGGPGEPYVAARVLPLEVVEGVAFCSESSAGSLCEGIDDPATPVTAQTITRPAFPGAEGFGAETPGGRDGAVCRVTNLNDSGSGSFRSCVEMNGPRFVVFRTGGTINLLSELEILNPYITIAGQTAPGGGIAIKADESYKNDALNIGTHDVIIRGLRVRPDNPTQVSSARAAINIRKGAHNVILDHVSASWGLDNVMEILDGAHDVTVQWSIISEGLSHSTHAEGEHSRGLNISVKTYNCPGCETRNISVHDNLFAHNRQRNPHADAYDVVDFVNNVIYNFASEGASLFGDKFGATTPVNIVGNYYKEGPNTGSGYEVKEGGTADALGPYFWVDGNIGPHRTDDSLPDDLVVNPEGRDAVVGTRFPAPDVSPTSAPDALTAVLGWAGATKPQRDTADSRVVADVENGTGHIIDDPTEVGGWPTLNAGQPPNDSDEDGMPKGWEENNGTNPNVWDASGDVDGDGWTNIEEYINGRLPR